MTDIDQFLNEAEASGRRREDATALISSSHYLLIAFSKEGEPSIHKSMEGFTTIASMGVVCAEVGADLLGAVSLLNTENLDE